MSYRNGHWQDEKKGRDRPSILICVAQGCNRSTVGSSKYCSEHTREFINYKERAQMAQPGSGTGTGMIEGQKVPIFDPETRAGVGTVWDGTIGGSNAVLPVGAKLNREPGMLACNHLGADPVLTLKSGKKLYAAQGGRLTAESVAHIDLILDCAGLVKDPRKFVVRSTVRRLMALNAAVFPDLVRLDWPDMSAPTHVGIRFWEGLLGNLPDRTLVCCYGAHGRTGTCLAALLVADGVDADEAIRRVREGHCVKAIETAGQEAYIRKLRKAGV